MNKKIGLCIEQIHTPSSVRLIKAIRSAVEANGDFFSVFHTGDNWFHKSFHHKALDSIAIDAYIVEASTFMAEDHPIQFAKAVSELGQPVVLIDPADSYRSCGVPYIGFSNEESFRNLMKHLLYDRNCKTIDLLVGEALRGIPDALLDIYEEELELAGIPYEERRVEKSIGWNGSIKRNIDRLLEYDRPDAVICMDDRAANYLNNILADTETDTIHTVVCSVDKGYVDENTLIVNTGCKRSAEETAAETLKIVHSLMENEEVERSTILENVLVKTLNNLTDKQRSRLARRRFGELEEEQVHNANAEMRQHHMMMKILENEAMDDIAELLMKILPKESFFAVPEGFLDGYSKAGTKEDGLTCYIFADQRKMKQLGGEFILQDSLADPSCVNIVFPIRIHNGLSGFLVYQGDDYDRELYVLERLAVNLADTFYRYSEDRELQFANRELLHANERMKQLQVRDTTTGMFNQRGLVKELELVKERAIEENGNIVLIAIDLIGLAKINSIYGHSEGDAAIIALSEIIENNLNAREVTAHIGADEFIIATTGGVESDTLGNTLIKSILLAVENYNRISDKEYSIEINYVETKSIPNKDTSVKKLLDDLLSEKRIKKNNQRNISNSTDEANTINLEEKTAVLDVINHNKFRYAFQPIVHAKTGEIFAYEALMRSDTEKPLSPFVILKYASMEKRFYDIERATFFNVLERVKAAGDLLTGKRVFVNSIPGYMLDDCDYAKLKKDYGSLFNQITVEITEQTELDDQGGNTIKRRSAEDGFDIAIDDYGSGYANTATLLKYLPNCVKIDRLLITEIQSDPKKQHFVRNIIEFAHDNGFLALAEGVETLAELRAVIHMDVDLIQGYYTAKPGFEFIQAIAPEIKQDILNANMNSSEVKSLKAYVLGKEPELPLMRLALEGYNTVIMADQELTLLGNPDYYAGMSVKIKDGSNAILHIRNVKIEKELTMPCIEIGRDAKLTLVVEGDNEFKGNGIRVPEGSELILEGNGTLSIIAKERNAFGIGNDAGTSFGSITQRMSGSITMKVDGDNVIGIGGGIYRKGEGISILSGDIKLHMSGTETIGIGCEKGNVPILVDNCGVSIDMRCYVGVCVGSRYGEQNIKISSAKVTTFGSGDLICGLGTLEESSGTMDFTDCSIEATFNTRKAILIGCEAGCISYNLKNTRFELVVEGTEAIAFGSRDDAAKIYTEYSSIYLKARAEKVITIGAAPGNCYYIGGERILQVNSDKIEIPANRAEK